MKKKSLKRRIYYACLSTAFIIYILSVFYITLGDRTAEERRAVLEPFYSLKLIIKDKNYFYMRMWYCNIAMLIPFGILVPMINNKFCSAKRVVLSGFLFSLAIEITQYFTGRGLFEVDDLIANTLGAFIGYILFYVVNLIFNGKKKAENNF